LAGVPNVPTCISSQVAFGGPQNHLPDKAGAMDYLGRKTRLNADISGICVKLNTLTKLSFGYTA